MAEKRSLLRRFFGGLWRIFDVLRKLILVFAVFISVGLFALMIVTASPPPIEDNVALVWAPQGELVEQTSLPSGGLLPALLGEVPPQTEVRELIQALEYAADDNRIKMLFIKVDGLQSAGLGQLQSLVRALEKFKESGKKVVSFAPQMGQGQYLLASQADELYLDPLGAVIIPGMGRYGLYFQEALEKLNIDVHIFRAGLYKSAVEPFERSDMSPEAAAATKAWLDVLWGKYTAAVASARDIEAVDVHAFAEDLPERVALAAGNMAQLAVDAGLVDELIPLHEVRKRVGATVGMDDSHGSFRQVHHRNYLARVKREDRSEVQNRIAWVVVEGPIVDGEGDTGNAGADAISRRIDDLTREDKVKALVVRVNSPGGSVMASETLRRALNRFQETDRPVVVSMSSVAASGGYWMSMDASQIWAESGTLTGSIGVFGMVPNLSRAFAELGLNTDGVATTHTAGDLRTDRPLSPEGQAAIQSVVEYSYQQFVDGVSAGRELTADATAQAAEGRVWSGEDALRLGLVDHLGGPHQAIAAAADLADIEDYRVEKVTTVPDMLTLLKRRFKLSLQANSWMSSPWLQPMKSAVESLSWLQDPQGVYAHCLCDDALLDD